MYSLGRIAMVTDKNKCHNKMSLGYYYTVLAQNRGNYNYSDHYFHTNLVLININKSIVQLIK